MFKLHAFSGDLSPARVDLSRTVPRCTVTKSQGSPIMILQVPQVVFKTRVRNEALGGPNPFEWKDLSTDDIFKGKKVVLFSLPGAFTPTCSTSHLPRYEELYSEFQAQGVDAVVCLSVNDAFVMYQWGKSQNAENVFLLPDGNGEFTRKMGMLVKKENLGFGDRSWRYAMFVDNGTIEKMFVEPGFADNFGADPFEVSDADTMLKYLKSR
ncbi:peroxiredoxin [Acanthopleuribacter pedis]|uniref:Glutathione-dependent peroxiredoxin n=2 Tax=Acanthopleuribacter pedis TaxID=442870 RepID=A0A8J7QD52_9BACT|nr:peroxiredoxin [Acanthopleuribacter pedis]MBO1317405.1 peroxiredoxin [Acanthopleuribacter pedis]